MIMLECKIINGQPCLCATDEESEIALRKAEGKVLAVKTERARSPRQHRMFFSVLKYVFENQDRFKSIDDLREATLLEVGHSELREKLDGSRYRIAKSIAFHNCKQDKFQKIFDKSIDSWVEYFGHEHSVLLNQAPVGRQYHG